MSTSIKNKRILRRIYHELWNRGNLVTADEIFAKPEGVKQYVSNFLAAFPDLKHEVTEIIAEGDKVAASWTARGTQKGNFHNIPATNRVVAFTGVTIAQIEQGKILQHRTQWDTLVLLEQLGVVSAPIFR